MKQNEADFEMSARKSAAPHFLVLVRMPPALWYRQEQYLKAEFRNETAALKTKHREDLQQLRNELEEKHQREMALLVAEKEAYFQKQVETKEQQFSQKLFELLEKHRQDSEELQIQANLKVREVELQWKQKYGELHNQLDTLINEKEMLQKNINEEVESRVQATLQRLADREKEVCSLQTVLELRTDEIRSLRKDLEKLAAASSECVALRERNQTLLNRLEGLEAQLEHKTNEERRLQSELSALSSQCREEINRSRRLSMEKEELQWKLSLQADKSSSFERSISSKSLSIGDVASGTPRAGRRPLPLLKLSPIPSGGQTNNNNDGEDLPAASSTPRDCSHPKIPALESPTSPTVRNFMEKSASVAYVLDLGESALNPPSPASPWQRRRGLFRFSSLRWTKSKDTHKFK